MENHFVFGLIVAVAATLFVSACVGTGSTTGAAAGTGGSVDITNTTALAKCLSENGAVMYGAYWCGHCQNQKALFGDDFKYVDYVECTQEQQKCIDAGVQGFPTWIINGQKLVGEQTLEELAAAAGCG